MKFEPIDLQTLPRGEMFYYFSKMAPTGYSLTVSMDVTKLRQTLKETGLKFFPAYLWLVTKNLNQQMEFKMAVQEETLGYFHSLTPLYATFHREEHTFSMIWTEFSDDFHIFYQNYLENQEKYGNGKGVLSRPELPPPNAYTVSCVPWISFEHFAVHNYEKKDYFFPSVEAGAFREEGEKVWMPLSLTCHHAATDGYHVHLFLQDLQKDMDTFEQYLL